tara:strand:- start:386 stop:1048 length:663 start_codon:yes stop_codon:yes gene_type:complete
MALTKITGEGVGAVDDLTVNRSGNGVAQTIQNSGTTVGEIGVNSTDNMFFVSTNTGFKLAKDEAALIPAQSGGSNNDNALDLGFSTVRWKDLYLGGGAYIGGTGAANYLDDYEEGTWTPTTSSGSFTVSTANYVKIGSLVHCNFNLTVASTVSAVDFGGLPFSSNAFAGGILGFQNSEAGEVYSIFVQTGTIWNFRVGSVQKGAANSSNLRGSFSFTTDA